MASHHPFARLTSVLFVVVLAIVWFGCLVPRHLAKTDEGRYAEIPREMLASGDWITPRLDGLKYFEKPPLQYWATALAFRTFGPSEWTTRLWTGLTGFLGVLLVSYTGRRLYGAAAGTYAGAVLASSLLYLLMAHVATLDMGVTAFMSAGLCATLLARQSRSAGAARAWMLAAWAALALAVLSKGLEGIVLPGLVLVAYLVTTQDWTLLRRLELALGPVVFLLICAPWFIAVSLLNPDFPHFFFIHEHFERFLTTSHHREGPWWYFVPILAIGLLPWIFVLPASVAFGWRETHLPSQNASGRFMPARLLLLWSGLIFLFFSASSSKLPSYILPIFPALAILAGAYLSLASARVVFRLALATALAALVLSALGLYGIPLVSSIPAGAEESYAAFGRGLALAGAIWLIGAVGAMVLVLQDRTRGALLLLAASALFAESTGLVAYDALDRFASAYYVAQALDQAEALTDPATPLYSVQMYDQTLPFYLRRTMILVNQRDELDFGLSAEPDRGIPTLAAFAGRWQADARAVAVMPPTTFATLQAMNLPMRVIQKDGRFVVVSKP